MLNERYRNGRKVEIFIDGTSAYFDVNTKLGKTPVGIGINQKLITEHMLRILNSGSWVLDVGAGSGLSAIFAAKKARLVTAMEPDLESAAMLFTQARLNQLNNFQVLPLVPNGILNLGELFRNYPPLDVLRIHLPGQEKNVIESMGSLEPGHIFIETDHFSFQILQGYLALKSYLCTQVYNGDKEVFSHFVYIGK